MTNATPRQMIEAWAYVTHQHRLPDFVERALREDPPKIADPTYHRDSGWASASDIKNESLIPAMRNYLERQGVTEPPATSAAWNETLRRKPLRAEIETAVRHALESVESEARPTVKHYAGAVVEAMLEYVR